MVEITHINSHLHPEKEIRLKKYILIYCSEGSIAVEIDGTKFVIPSNHVITITSGQFHKYFPTTNGKGLILRFTYDFFCKNDIDIELIFENGLFCHFDRNEVIDVSIQPHIQSYLESIEEELHIQPYQHLISIHAKIALILVSINRAKIEHGDEIWKPNALFLKFLELIRAEFHHGQPVKYYAEKLTTTEAKLNELSKIHAGKTAQQIIFGLIISEAQRLFLYEELSVKETAFALGFTDPFYFSNFFKKHTKLSPHEYKAKIGLR
ncbi:MAG TPA: helix-turn-helix domain-containing protein [Saprospiraceae bacterium]|nr:helix-turn-helix domain-containing protein [Saprospiraceae bacterium]